MLSIVFSTLAFFVAGAFVKRYLEQLEVPKGLTRGTLIFTVALAVAYVVGWGVDRLAR